MNKYLFVTLYALSWAAVLEILQHVLPAFLVCSYNFFACGLLTSIIAYFFYPFFKRSYFNERVVPVNKAVVITGCDTGFGHELAKRLHSKGFVVFASCLFPEGEGAKRLKDISSDRLHVLGLDVTKDESVQEAVQYVKSSIGNAELWALVNNAGVMNGSDVALTKMDCFRLCLDINTFGVVRITKAFLPLLFKSRGRVITVTSMASRIAAPHIAPYTMSKYATRAFCETLRQEMHPWGIRVIEIEPEGFKTPLCDEEALLARYDAVVGGVDEEIRSLYGEDYFKDYRQILPKLTRFSSSRIYKVIDDLEDAVSLDDPNDVYNPTNDGPSKAVNFAMKNLPTPVIDTFIRAMERVAGYPVPKGAVKQPH